MSLKIAIATSDGKNVDTHFGRARKFFIYNLEKDSSSLLEERASPLPQEDVENAEKEFRKCMSGCGSGGGGCSEQGKEISPTVSLLLDCTAILASHIGENVKRQFARNAISCFDVELPIESALEKLSAYYKKINLL